MGRPQFTSPFDLTGAQVAVDNSLLTAIKNGEQKSFDGTVTGIVDGNVGEVINTDIPAGETWYLVSVSFGWTASGKCLPQLFNFTTSNRFIDATMDGGDVIFAGSPIKLGADGDTIKLGITNRTGGLTDMTGSLVVWYAT